MNSQLPPPQNTNGSNSGADLDRALQIVKEQKREKQEMLIDMEHYREQISTLSNQLDEEKDKSEKLEMFIRNVAMRPDA
jgi:hypothetical protein